jgi:hypothetical protein
MFSAKLVIISVLDKNTRIITKKIPMFYDHSFVSSISLFQGRRFRLPYP